LRFEVPTEPSARSVKEEELIVEIQKLAEELKQGIRQEGKLKGRVATHARVFSRRLGRPFSDAERAVLAERLDRLGEDRLVDLVLTHDGDALAAWLTEPAER
jgi:hypothetical protein